MKAQIIVIGDELLSGRISDANTAPLARWLENVGFHLTRVVLSRDKEEELLPLLKSAWEENDLVITTGGLGPTKDDITKHVFDIFINGSGGTQAESEKAKELVKSHYLRINKTWNPTTNHYHMLPKNLDVFSNPRGLAPGLIWENSHKVLLATPGVPRELISMIEGPMPEILARNFKLPKTTDQNLIFKTHSIPEEIIFYELMPNLWSELEAIGKVSSLPQVMGVDIVVTFKGTKEDLIKEEKKWEERLMNSPLAPHVWSVGPALIEEVVVKKAIEKGLTFGFAESCTGGLVGHRITNVSGSSSVFKGSLVTYANEAKENILNVSSNSLAEFGAVSEQVAEQMAKGAREALDVDIAISLTGIAGPGGGSKEKPVGTICIGQSSKKINRSKRYQMFGSREHLKRRFSEKALFGLYKLIDTF